MSEQILLQGKILGTEEFLLAPPGGRTFRALRRRRSCSPAGHNGSLCCAKCCRAPCWPNSGWRAFCSVRAAAASSCWCCRAKRAAPAEEFLSAAARQIGELSGGYVHLALGVTDNLGDWAVIRKRLNEELQRKRHARSPTGGADAFQPFASAVPARCRRLFREGTGAEVREASPIGWSPETPGKVRPGAGKHTWSLTSNLSLDGIMLARHAAPSDDGKIAAPCRRWRAARRAARIWGVLRGDVDNFGVRLRRVHYHRGARAALGALQAVLRRRTGSALLLPEFWRKVTHHLFRRRRFRGLRIAGTR